MASFARFYSRNLNRHPIFVQSATAGTLFLVGDGISQHVIEKKPLKDHDYSRTALLGSYGTFVVGPGVALWYRFLNKQVTLKNKALNTLCRTALDQLIFAPASLAFFFVYTGTFEFKTKEEIQAKLNKQWWPTLVANWYVWPPVQLVNFYVTPLNYQSLVVNSVALGWNTYLAYVH